MSHINHVTIDGVTYRLVAEDAPGVEFNDVYDEYYDDYKVDESEEVAPVITPNRFGVGDYVTVAIPKRPGHRIAQSGKVVAMTPSAKWSNPFMPEVYVEFATSAPGCGNAEGRVASCHGCRMPVSGLLFA